MSPLGQSESVHIRGDREVATKLVAQAAAELEQAPSPGTLTELTAVVERRLRRGGPPPLAASTTRSDLVEGLADRELAVLRLLPARLTQREMGDALYLSMNTVETHIRDIFRKLSVSSRDEAVEVARSMGSL